MNLSDGAKGQESMNALPNVLLHEKGKWIGRFSLKKWDFGSDDKTHAAFDADSQAGMSDADLHAKYGSYLISDEVVGENLLTNYGINSIIWPAVAGGSYTAMNNTNARLGVGDSTTAAAASQTDLQAATNKTYQAMDATYPTYGSSQQIVLRATFAG